MARVVREKSKVLSGSIGINTTGGAYVSNSLNQIASAANNASQMMFTRANEIAQEEGIQAGKDLTIDQITTLDENTGKPALLSYKELLILMLRYCAKMKFYIMNTVTSKMESMMA